MATVNKFISVSGVVSTDLSASVGALPVEILYNGIASTYSLTTDIPADATSINAIKLFYRRLHTGNLYLKFRSSYIDVDSVTSVTNDADSLTVYAGGGTDGYIASITVPTAAINGLPTIDPDDIVGIEVQRDATNASDTYEADLQIVGFQFTFVTTTSTTATSPTEYCNITTDLYRIYPRIEEFKEQKTIRGWVLHSGSIYKKGNGGYGEMLFENNLPLSSVNSIGAITAGKFYYDSDNDIIYAQATSGNVTDTANTYLWGIDWDTVKQWAVRQASERIDAMLDPRFPIPLPESSKVSSTQKWDAPLVNATALMAVSLIAARKEPPKFSVGGDGENVSADLFLAAKSIIDQYNNGSMLFSWEVSKDEIGGYEIIPTSGNTSLGMFQLRGDYVGAEDDVWVLKISTGGALGTAQYQLSQDNGTTYGTAATIPLTHLWTTLANSVKIRFFARGGGASSFILNDTWTINLTASTETLSRGSIGSGSMVA